MRTRVRALACLPVLACCLEVAVSTLPKSFITPEQYLEIERAAGHKSEYFNGEMFAMAGAPENHGLIQMNVCGLLWQQIRGKPCRGYTSEMRVRVSPTGLYTYPDATVVCGEPAFLDQRRDTLINPTLVVEVLSPSTEAYDRGRKFEHYQTIESLRYYLLISSERVRTDLFMIAEGRWSAASRLEDTIELEAVGCQLKLADIYEKVEFEPTPLRAQNT